MRRFNLWLKQLSTKFPFTNSNGSNEERPDKKKTTTKRPSKPKPKGSEEESSKPESSTKHGPKASNEEGSSETLHKPTTQNPKRDPENPDSKPVEDGPWFINPPTGPPDKTQVF